MRQVWITEGRTARSPAGEGSARPLAQARRAAHSRRGHRRQLRRHHGADGHVPRPARPFRSSSATRSAAASMRWASGVGPWLGRTRRVRDDALRRLLGRGLRARESGVRAAGGHVGGEDGAAIPVNYFTAWQLVVVMGGLREGETMLVHSAGGGVGIAATQIAKHIGATVIGTASTSKHEYPARHRRRSSDRLPPRGLREAHDGHHGRARRRAHPRRGRRRLVQEGLPHAGADRSAGHVRHVVGGDRQAAQRAQPAADGRIDAVAAVHAGFAHRSEQGRVRRQPRPPVGRGRPHPRLGRALARAFRQGRREASRRQDLPVRRGRRGAPLRSGPANVGKVLLAP